MATSLDNILTNISPNAQNTMASEFIDYFCTKTIRLDGGGPPSHGLRSMLLRLILGVTRDDNDNEFYSMALSSSLLNSYPLNIDDKVMLQTTIYLVLDCLFTFTHHNCKDSRH